jgi:hypothetical protein
MEFSTEKILDIKRSGTSHFRNKLLSESPLPIEGRGDNFTIIVKSFALQKSLPWSLLMNYSNPRGFVCFHLAHIFRIGELTGRNEECLLQPSWHQAWS